MAATSPRCGGGLLVVALLGLSGCAGLRSEAVREKARETNDAFIGRPAAELTRLRGEPDYRGVSPDGGETWTYERMPVSSPREEFLDPDPEARLRVEEGMEMTEVVTFTLDPNGIVRDVAVAVE